MTLNAGDHWRAFFRRVQCSFMIGAFCSAECASPDGKWSNPLYVAVFPLTTMAVNLALQDPPYKFRALRAHTRPFNSVAAVHESGAVVV